MATPNVDFLKLFAELDKDLFFYLNHNRHKFLDLVLPYFSDEKIIYAFFLFFGAILVSLFKWRGLIAALLTWLCVLGTDFTCGKILKPYFARQRPLAVHENVYCYNYQKKEWYQTTNPTKSTSYSLPSCHAANVACAATIMATLLPRFSFLFWAFAITVAYSRVYLGVHYPFDVCFGFLLGYLIGLVGRLITRRVLEE